MTKVQIAVSRSVEDDVLRWLQEHEVIQLTKTERTEGNVAADATLDRQLAQLQFALEFIASVRSELGEEKKSSWRNLFATKPAATLASLEQTIDGLDLNAIGQQVKAASGSLAEISGRRQEIRDIQAVLQPWQALAIRGSDLAGTQSVRHALITYGAQEDLLVKQRLQEVPTLTLHEVNRITRKKHGTVYLEVVVGRSHEKHLQTVLDTTNAALVELPLPAADTVAEHLAAFDAELTELQRRYVHVLDSAQSIVALERKLQFAYDALLHRQERYLARQLAQNTTYAIVWEGWTQKRSLPVLKKQLTESYPASALAEITPKKDEEPPVAFTNSRLIEPFEAVTNIYGKPRYNELDPSGALSLFFLVAFGLALTDAGYGIVMMLLMSAAQKFFRLKREMRKMVRLLFFAGASTTIFGALTGGWFGINLEQLPAGELRNVLLTFKIIDPISEPMTLLVAAFAIGIVQLLFAWAVRAYDHARKKDYVALAFDDAAWITMVVAVLLWAGSTRGLLPEAWSQLLLWAVLLNGGVLVATGGRSFSNPLLKLGGGVLSLYGLVSFLSDTLSYSRLLALGLATGIIALVVNLIGGMIVESVPYVGWLVAAIVLLGGHVFNLAINALGAFIHSGRLQFVEFFPKFMEGGGTPFRPFGRVSKYVDDPKEFA